MTEEPRALTDIDLFPEHAPRTPPEPDPEKARFVLELLTAAGLKSPFGIDIDKSEEIWGIKLAVFDIQTLTEAVDQWISEDTNAFPAVGELVSIALRIQNRHRAIERGNQHPLPGMVCAECQGDAWVEVGEQGTIATVRPCRACRPAQYDSWLDGAYMPKIIRTDDSDGPQQSEAAKAMLQEMLTKLGR